MLHELDRQAVGHAQAFRNAEALILDDLMELQKIDGFRKLGYRSLFAYCKDRLKLSEAQSSYYLRVARKSEEVPELKHAIEEKRINLSEARRIAAVITPETSEDWIGKAEVLPQRELEKAVSEVNPRAAMKDRLKPVAKDLVQLQVGLSEAAEEKLRRVQDLLSQQQGHAVSLQEAIEGLCDFFLEKKDPVKKAERVLSSGRAKPLLHIKPGRQAIPASVRHAVNVRDRGRCTVPGCRERRWLQLHHIKPVSQGGVTVAGNLETLCSFTIGFGTQLPQTLVRGQYRFR